MKLSFLIALISILGPLHAVAAPEEFRSLPSTLWAMQVVLPPGTTGAVNTQTVFPPGVPVPVGGAIVQGAPANGQAGPAPGGPIGADGRMPGIPAGVPLPGPGGSPPTSGPAAAQPAVVPNPTPTVVPVPETASTIDPQSLVAEPVCEVRLRLARIDIPAEGGEFIAPANVVPERCVPSISFAASWLSLTDTPAMQFTVEPNTGATTRDAMIVIGQTSFFVRQSPPVQPGLAAAPSHLVFGIDKNGKAESKRITAWTEQGTGLFKARSGHPWLIVTPKRGKANRQAYEVRVQRNAGLGPGRHDSFVDVIPAGKPDVYLRIPVVVEVMGKF